MWTVQRWKQALAGVAVTALLAGTLGVGTVAAAEEEKREAEVTVAIQPAAASGSSLAYSITISNSGDGYTKNVVVSIPYNSSALQPAATSFGTSGMWLSQNGNGRLEFQTGRISSGEQASATVRFNQLVTGSAAQLSEPLSYRWLDESAGGSGRSNLISAASLSISQIDGELTVSGAGFVPNEAVVLWFNAPNGEVRSARVQKGTIYDGAYLEAKYDEDDESANRGATYLNSDEQGQVTASLNTRSLAPGRYSLVARGNASGITLVSSFDVQ